MTGRTARHAWWMALALRAFPKRSRSVPAQWHGWMRDDLTSRWVGHRFGMYTIVQVWAVLAVVTVADQGALPAWYIAVVYLAITVLTAPFHSRRVRRTISRKTGWLAGAPLTPPQSPPSGSLPH